MPFAKFAQNWSWDAGSKGLEGSDELVNSNGQQDHGEWKY